MGPHTLVNKKVLTSFVRTTETKFVDDTLVVFFQKPDEVDEIKPPTIKSIYRHIEDII